MTDIITDIFSPHGKRLVYKVIKHSFLSFSFLASSVLIVCYAVQKVTCSPSGTSSNGSTEPGASDFRITELSQVFVVCFSDTGFSLSLASSKFFETIYKSLYNGTL